MPDPKEEMPVVADDGNEQYASKNEGEGRSGNKALRSNPNENVGGTAKDGGLSTEATVADGGPDDAKADPTYKPS